MGLVRAWRRQIYGASLVAILIPASIIVVLFALTGGGPLHGLGTLGQVFSGPAIPGGNLSARVSLNSKAALPGNGTAGAAALRGHSPVIGQPSTTPSSGSHGPAVAPVKVGTTPPSAPTNGGQLRGGSGVGASGTGGNPPPRPPANTPTTTTTSSTTTDSTTAASLPPIVAVPPPPVTSTSTTTPTIATTTTTTTPVHTTTTTTRTTTTTSTTKTTTTSTTTPTTRTTTTTKTTTTPTTKTTTTPTTKTTTTTVTRTTTTIRPPTSKTATKPLDNPAAALATTVAQAEHGSATFTGCSGNWGVRSGHVEQIAPAASLHAASNGGTSTAD